MGSALVERVGKGEVVRVTRGMTSHAWWLLGLALKEPWLALDGPPHALNAWTGFENTTCMLVNEWAWSKS